MPSESSIALLLETSTTSRDSSASASAISNPLLSGSTDVQQHDLGAKTQRKRECTLAVSGFTDHLEAARFQQLRREAAEAGVIVDDEDPRAHSVDGLTVDSESTHGFPGSSASSGKGPDEDDTRHSYRRGP
jgi:hypothetical protein